MVRRGILWAFLGGLLLMLPAAWASFIMPPTAPVDRLIKNVTAYTKEHPQDAEGYYTLGRLNYLAFHLNQDRVGIFGKEEEGKLQALAGIQVPGRVRPGEPRATTLPAEQVPEHVREAVVNFRKAIAMKPESALYHLGLASVLNEGAAVADRIGLVPGDADAETVGLVPEAAARREAAWQALLADLGAGDSKTREAATAKFQEQTPAVIPFLVKNVDHKDPEIHARIVRVISNYWRGKAIPEYLKAYQLTAADDLKIPNQPPMGLNTLVSFEAGTQYTQLVKARGVAESETEQVAKVEKDLQTLEGKPMGPVTPILFSVARPAELSDLLAPAMTTPFNLDGTGRPQAWTWVKPTTAILVWDPDHTGKITSGHQLFGTVAFNMFWSDGYRALDALDDNRDGVLTGSELTSLALWFDRNGDGRADPGEVVPIEKTDIVAIRVWPDVNVAGAAAAARAGLILRDGRVLPTYDWLAQPQAEAR